MSDRERDQQDLLAQEGGGEKDPLIIKQRLERHKREALIEAIDVTLSGLARQAKDLATDFANKTLEEIQQGNNPDLEPALRQKAAELGIELNG